MISDVKALRAALLLKRYCGERGCKDGVCAFRSENGICPMADTRLPESWQLDDLKPKQTEVHDG